VGVTRDCGSGGMRAINCAIVVEPGGAREGRDGRFINGRGCSSFRIIGGSPAGTRIKYTGMCRY